MNLFAYRAGELYCEDLPVAELAARFGTPLYIYSVNTLRAHYERIAAAFAPLDPLICYSVKSCSNTHILRQLAALGSGFDVVSGGELFRVLHAGGTADRTVFAGVGKNDQELREALAAGVHMLNVESASELERIAALAAEAGVRPDVALRVIPEVAANTHDYTTTGTIKNKFGVTLEDARTLCRQYHAHPALHIRGLHLHIGSPVMDPEAYAESIRRALALIDTLAGDGITLDTLDIGGGFGAHYQGGEAPPAQAYADVIVPLLRDRRLRIVLEPGRSISANAGILVGRVLHVKQTATRRFVISDAAMTELIRPALYGAYHFIWPVAAGAYAPQTYAAAQPFTGLETVDVVGPVCESGDFLAKERQLPPVQRGELLAVFTCGAYGSVMASQYNSRCRAAEVLVDGTQAQLIRRRETYADLIASEPAGES